VIPREASCQVDMAMVARGFALDHLETLYQNNTCGTVC